MCFPRKPGLGRYHATRSEWTLAYRQARIAAAKGAEPDPKTTGVIWKAQLIVANERNRPDALACSVQNRLATCKLIDEIEAEEIRLNLE
ncbi:hypothetical protein [Pseudomonas sp. 2FE]|uniref:hypothetical protein n=1 Tax=Pseudomonas sp. 2FE TaxID=2502190 RepID=UPI0010F63C81|nr:hypothetical protein [Pseudomonas sp. 2FE]